MGDKWIKGNIIDAIGEEQYASMVKSMLKNEDNVGNYLFNIQKDGTLDIIRLSNGDKLK